MVYGYDITMPPQIFRRIPIYNYDNYADMQRRELHDAWYLAQEKLRTQKEYNKTQYDKKANPIDIQPGDMVLIKNQVKSGKHDELWKGPYEVDWVEEKYITINKKGSFKKVSKDNVKLSKAYEIEEIPTDHGMRRIINHLQQNGAKADRTAGRTDREDGRPR